ncbi:hypothetical protein LCGC14_0847990 [marine sediment metagenome]|uniref:Uncharacterized protein n=1 Tax=marine sediment metagenome TaxID=412755 RepID=A0A0F9SI81_9ZZZZ
MRKTTITVCCGKCRRSFPFDLSDPRGPTQPRILKILCTHCGHQVGTVGVWKAAGGLVREASFGKRVTIRILYTPDEKEDVTC